MSRTDCSPQMCQTLLTEFRGDFRSKHFRRNCLYDIPSGRKVMDLQADSQPAASAFDEELLSTIGYRSERAISINFEIIVPWLMQNILKRCHQNVDEFQRIIEETLQDSFDKNLLLPSDLRLLLYRLNIVVTDEIIYELCRRYAAEPRLIEKRMEEDMRRAQSKSNTTTLRTTKKSKHALSKSDDEDEDFEDDAKDGPPERNYRQLRVERFQPKSNDKDRGLSASALIADLTSGDALKPVNMEAPSTVKNEESTNLVSGIEVFESSLAPRWSRTVASVNAIVKARKALVNTLDSNGRSALLFASAIGNLSAVRALLVEGADVVIGSGDESPMSVARSGDIKAALERHFIALMTTGSIGKMLSVPLQGDEDQKASDGGYDEKQLHESGLTGFKHTQIVITLLLERFSKSTTSRKRLKLSAKKASIAQMGIFAMPPGLGCIMRTGRGSHEAYC